MPSNVDPAIFVHANIADLKVTARCMTSCRVSVLVAVGLLTLLWGQAAQHATDGNLAAESDDQIELWARWHGKKGLFAKFIREHHLDPDGRPREWEEWAGKLAVQRRKERDKKRHQRVNVPGTSRGQVGDKGGDSPGDVPSVPSKILERRGERGEVREDHSTSTTAREAFASPEPAMAPRGELDWWPDEGTRATIGVVFSEIPEKRQGPWRAALSGMLDGIGIAGGKAASARDVAEGLIAARTMVQDVESLTPRLVAGCAADADRRRATPLGASPRGKSASYLEGELAKVRNKIAAGET